MNIFNLDDDYIFLVRREDEYLPPERRFDFRYIDRPYRKSKNISIRESEKREAILYYKNILSPFSKRKRRLFNLIKEQDGLCSICGNIIKEPTFDHVIPLSKGGKNDKSNLAAACKKCNYDKGDKIL